MQLETVELCFPQLLNSSCRKPEPPQSGTVLIYTVMPFISLLTAVLNLLVIISISHFRQLHTPTNILLLSLAVSDFLVGLLLMPVEILLTRTCWMFGDLLCAMYYLLPVTIIYASAVNMVLISVDRFVAICEPLHYCTKVTPKVVKICVSLGWTYCVLYSIALLYESLTHPGRYTSCHGECFVNISGAVDLGLAFIAPMCIIIVLYIRIFVVAASQARAMRSHIAAVTLKRSMTVKVIKSEIKAGRTLGIIIIVFLLCYSPYYCVTLTGHNILLGTSIEVFMIFLMYFNSCLNPIIYALFYPWFRKSIRLIVTFQILKRDSCDANIL